MELRGKIEDMAYVGRIGIDIQEVIRDTFIIVQEKLSQGFEPLGGASLTTTVTAGGILIHGILQTMIKIKD